MNNVLKWGLRGLVLITGITLAAGAVYATGVVGGGGTSAAPAVTAIGVGPDGPPDYSAAFGSTGPSQDAKTKSGKSATVATNGAEVSRTNRRAVAEAAAPIIGVSLKELAQDVRDGQSIVAIAAAHNISADQLRDGLIASEKSSLDKAVAAGDINQQQADLAAKLFANQVGRYLGDPAAAKAKAKD